MFENMNNQLMNMNNQYEVENFMNNCNEVNMTLSSTEEDNELFDNTYEWEYHMRREMQQIIPGVWLGPYASALRTREQQLDQAKITHIICVRQDIEAHWIRPNFDKYTYLTLNIADVPTQNIIQYFQQVRLFIDDCLSKGGQVLVHGNAGISRSAALVVAYIMEKLHLNSNEAIRLVQKKRFCIFPNEGFRRQLMEYEPILKARGVPIGLPGGRKRPFGDEDSDSFDSNQMDINTVS